MGNDLRKVLKALEDQGFLITRSSKGHWLIDTPRTGSGSASWPQRRRITGR